jgi:hypothetical protein
VCISHIHVGHWTGAGARVSSAKDARAQVRRWDLGVRTGRVHATPPHAGLMTNRGDVGSAQGGPGTSIRTDQDREAGPIQDGTNGQIAVRAAFNPGEACRTMGAGQLRSGFRAKLGSPWAKLGRSREKLGSFCAMQGGLSSCLAVERKIQRHEPSPAAASPPAIRVRQHACAPISQVLRGHYKPLMGRSLTLRKSFGTVPPLRPIRVFCPLVGGPQSRGKHGQDRSDLWAWSRFLLLPPGEGGAQRRMREALDEGHLSLIRPPDRVRGRLCGPPSPGGRRKGFCSPGGRRKGSLLPECR